jgi:hypothetical protein
VIETMTNNGHHRPNDAHAALYALLAGTEEGCGPAARLAQDDELADFLCKVQEIVGEAGMLLEERVTE